MKELKTKIYAFSGEHGSSADPTDLVQLYPPDPETGMALPVHEEEKEHVLRHLCVVAIRCAQTYGGQTIHLAKLYDAKANVPDGADPTDTTIFPYASDRIVLFSENGTPGMTNQEELEMIERHASDRWHPGVNVLLLTIPS